MESKFLHRKDKFGNDLYFGDTGAVLLPALPYLQDFAGHLGRIRDVSLRFDDVIVTCYPKSGCHWMLHMTTMLKEGTTDLPPYFGPTNFVSLGGSGGELKLPPPDKPRVLISHLPFRYLPRDVVEKKVKIVHITRNPKDVLVSFFCYVTQMDLPKGYRGTWPQFFEHMLDEEYWYGNIFDHLKDWEQEIESRPEHPIFQCRYEDTLKDTLGQVELLNQFLGTNRSRQLCQAIAEACEMKNMPLTCRFDESATDMVYSWKEGETSRCLFRKGIVGDWKNWFTVAQNERFDAAYETKMAGYKGIFLYE